MVAGSIKNKHLAFEISIFSDMVNNVHQMEYILKFPLIVM